MFGWVTALVTRLPWLGKAASWFSTGRVMWIAGGLVLTLLGALWFQLKLAKADAGAARADQVLAESKLEICYQSNAGLAEQLDLVRLQSEKNLAEAQRQRDRAQAAEDRAEALDIQAEAFNRERREERLRTITNDPDCAAWAADTMCHGLTNQLRQ